MASEQITYADEQAELSSALQDSEIARIMKLVSETNYKKSEDAPTRKKQEFKPRTLVEIAMEAEKKRDGDNIKSQSVSADQNNKTHPENRELNENATNESAENIEKQSEDIKQNTADPKKEDNNINQQPTSDLHESSHESSEIQSKLDDSEIKTHSEIESIKTNQRAKIVDEAVETNLNALDSETNPDPDQDPNTANIQYDNGFNDGLRAGKNEMIHEFKQKFLEQENTLDALISSLSKISFAETQKLEKDIQESILLLASERAGITISEFPEHFLKRIEKLINRLGTSAEKPVIKINKSDLQHIEKVREDSEKLSKINFIEDETLNHGDIIVSIGGIELEDILEKRILTKSLETYKSNNQDQEKVSTSEENTSEFQNNSSIEGDTLLDVTVKDSQKQTEDPQAEKAEEITNKKETEIEIENEAKLENLAENNPTEDEESSP
ncbi:flagellar assembly protein FliH [Alphaproteobacteria bacterium]|nr:flagellar assembly protein FliH [Alphaproteobacteria bacterium]